MRVILGFNCFTNTVGSCCLRAPEHSDAFNRTIKLYQTLASLGLPITEAQDPSSAASLESGYCSSAATNAATASMPELQQCNTHGQIKYSAKDIAKKNPALARLLVLAARKVKANQSALSSQTNDQNLMSNNTSTRNSTTSL